MPNSGADAPTPAEQDPRASGLVFLVTLAVPLHGARQARRSGGEAAPLLHHHHHPEAAKGLLCTHQGRRRLLRLLLLAQEPQPAETVAGRDHVVGQLGREERG